MTDSVVTSPSGISEGSCVKLSIYLACVHRFQDKWITLKHSPSNLQQGESVFVIVYAQLKICHWQDKTHRLRHHFPKFNPSLPPCILPPAPCSSLLFSLPPSLHCTACSLAVLPESWGFMTSGSSGGVEKDSILSCSNESSESRTEVQQWKKRRERGYITPHIRSERKNWAIKVLKNFISKRTSEIFHIHNTKYKIDFDEAE